MTDLGADIVVVGAGNAALAAALTARDAGANVIVLEAAPMAERGGNSSYTGGALRIVYDSVDDLRTVMPELSDEEIRTTDFGTYSADQYFDDMARLTHYRAQPELVETLVAGSRSALAWMRTKGIRFQPSYHRQAFKVDGRFKFWGGLAVESWGGGAGLMDAWYRAADVAGIAVHYETRATALERDDKGHVVGVVARRGGQTQLYRAKAVVLAAGGFEANAEWRARYLGPGWDLAKVRGSRHNQGDGIRMALEIGAMPFGHWSGCHSVGWDRNAPEFGDLSVGDGFQKHSYPFGIMVNARGQRFVDEGADFRNYTYAIYGRSILEQPGQFAWQVFDAKAQPLLRGEYRIKQATRVRADHLDALATQLEGVDPNGFLETVRAYNAAIRSDIKFDPNIKDGRCTAGLTPPKSNWAMAIDTPPFEAYAVTCGITFTFGGLQIDRAARVLDPAEQPIPGLYAAGELVGGLFYFNYPGGTGLVSGAVFGRIAGAKAAKRARSGA